MIVISSINRLMYAQRGKLLRFIQLQLFLTAISLPILIAWGLPISFMSCIGNLVYSPFLALFLLLSSLIFFLELCCIPNTWLIICLELLTKTWSWLIGRGSSSWLISFAKPPAWILIGFLLSVIFVMHYKKFSRSQKTSAGFFILLIGLTILLKCYPTQNVVIKHIPCNQGFVTIIKTKNAVTVIDPGVIGQRIAHNWIEYTLIKELIQNFGTINIDHFIVTKPGILTFSYAAQLCRLAKVSRIYLVLWKGESEKNLLRCYGRLYNDLKKQAGIFVRLGSNPLAFNLSEDATITINPLETTLQYKELIFPALQITVESVHLKETLDIFSHGYQINNDLKIPNPIAAANSARKTVGVSLENRTS